MWHTHSLPKDGAKVLHFFTKCKQFWAFRTQTGQNPRFSYPKSMGLDSEKRKNNKKISKSLHISSKKFAHIKKKQYLCSGF